MWQQAAALHRLVGGEADTAVLDGFGEAATDGTEDEGGNIPFGFQREIGGFTGKLDAAVKDKTGFLEEFA